MNRRASVAGKGALAYLLVPTSPSLERRVFDAGLLGELSHRRLVG